MGKKRQTFGEAMHEQFMGHYDRRAELARTHRLTGSEMRRVIDTWNVPYTRVAGWLGLTPGGLHKQMRGDRRISAQTWLLFSNLAKGFEIEAKAWTEEERQQPDSPAFRSKLRAQVRREERKLGL